MLESTFARVGFILFLTLLFGRNASEAVNASLEMTRMDECPCSIDKQCYQTAFDALNNVSKNSVVYIRVNATLPSIVTLKGLENVTIFGCRNSTINCKGIGALRFDSCTNVSMYGIKWKKCGSKNQSTYQGLRIYNSSNIVIEGCSFHHSAGQAMALSKVSGNVIINNCLFTHNSGDQGAAIYYTSSLNSKSLHLNIENCSFSSNKANRSIVHIASSTKQMHKQICLKNSAFIANQGAAVYLVHHSLHLEGNLWFENNVAISGGGILSNNSKITFTASNVYFHSNTANGNGGAIFLTESTLNFQENSFIQFVNNSARSGGAVYSTDRSVVIAGNNSVVMFNNNQAKHGGALCTRQLSYALLEGNSTMMLEKNNAIYGGGIYLEAESAIHFEANSTVTFTSNNATFGGAIRLYSMCFVYSDDNSSVVFSSNHATYGGAVNLQQYSAISFNGRSSVTFSYNKAANGGSVHCSHHSNMFISGNSKTTLEDNNAVHGAAMYFEKHCNISFDRNAIVRFSGNQGSIGAGIHSKDHCKVAFHGNSFVTFHNNSVTLSGGAVSSNQHSYTIFSGNSYVKFSNNSASISGGAGYFTQHSHAIFGESSTLQLNYNKAVRGGALHLRQSQKVFGRNSTVTFASNRTTKGRVTHSILSTTLFHHNSTVMFENNYAGSEGGSISIVSNSKVLFNGSSFVTFINSTATYGGILHSKTHSKVTFDGNSVVEMNNNRAKRGGVIYSDIFSGIIFDGSSAVKLENNEALYGGVIFSTNNSYILFTKHSTATFTRNHAIRSGGCVYSQFYSTISFNEISLVTFTNNDATHGGCVMTAYYGYILVTGNSKVTFTQNNSSFGGGIFASFYSNLSFSKNSTIRFNENHSILRGGSICIENHCNMLMSGNSTFVSTSNSASTGGAISSAQYSDITVIGTSSMTFINNIAHERGGSVAIENHCKLLLTEFSKAMFYGGKARSGGALYCSRNSEILFDHRISQQCMNCTFDPTMAPVNSSIVAVTFKNNLASHGGGIYLNQFSSVTFDGNSQVVFEGNQAQTSGGMAYIQNHCKVLFNGSSFVTIINHASLYGGAIFSLSDSTVSFSKGTEVMFKDSRATFGAAILSSANSDITYDNNAVVTFKDNHAVQRGGALYSEKKCKSTFDGYSKVTFYNNSAQVGGAIIIFSNSDVFIHGNTSVMFAGNHAITSGGSLHAEKYCNVLIKGSSLVSFNDSEANYGGAMYFINYCNVSFDQKSTVLFKGNKAIVGGTFHSTKFVKLYIGENSLLTFNRNSAKTGGAIHSDSNSAIIFEGNNPVSFSHNSAQLGGAISLQEQCKMVFRKNSTTNFNYNAAEKSGGAMHLSNSFTVIFQEGCEVGFYHNSAYLLGGAIYGELNEGVYTKLQSGKTSDIVFQNNSAPVGQDTYMHIMASCNETCLNNSVVGLPVSHNNPPRKLVLYEPALCTVNSKDCEVYLLKNVMLGQDIKVKACVLGFYDRQTSGLDFLIRGENNEHRIDGSQFVSVTCNYFEGLKIIGKEVSNVTNFSMIITSYSNVQSNISVKLIAELSLCHPGFQYDNATQSCLCYNNSNHDIVSCSGSKSYIKRGYWFGYVNGKPTVSICPNTYCNYSCCEATNGFYHLSPVRSRQCNSHRTGPACGSCEEGYSLSFDSVKCVETTKCTNGQTILVVTITVLYWILVVLLVFVMTYYHIGIGYLYAITFYYSMLDALLSENLIVSQGLHTAINIISSIVKVDPQFLGQLCLVQNMTGIDQQFIHYTHPLAITIIVLIICQAARMSYRFSAFVSRGIIQVICLLLLLSYTSVATTSLLLLRSLTFDNLDKVYTYLSPDIEYCHGRHLPYFIVAVLCTLVIVIGLPLLLLLEPFFRSKINFIKVRPLLDHFQGCYKDRFRWFAAYYMICRLVIIAVIIANPSGTSTTQLFLIMVTTILALFHVVFRPYTSDMLNIFDGMILHLMILLPTASLFDTFNPDFVLATVLTALVLPLLAFALMELIVYKGSISKIITHYKSKPADATNDHTTPVSDIGIIVDDNMRKNATVCEM